jgi:hypothetical protein
LAFPHLKSGLSLFHQIKEVNFTAGCVIALAGVAVAQGNAIRAAQLFGAGEAVQESIGVVPDRAAQSLRDAYVAKARAMLDVATFESAWAEGRGMTMEQTIEYALNEE